MNKKLQKNNASDYAVLFTTCFSDAEAKKIAKALVDEHFVACATIIPAVASIYRWKDELCEENETLMVIKSRAEHVQKIIERIQELHSYDVPEIIALPVMYGSKAYLDWVYQETNL